MDVIAKKVAKHNGDIRIAFDLIKTSLSSLYQKVKYSKEGTLRDDQIKITYDLVLTVFEEKYGSKVFEILKALPRQNIIVLQALVTLFDSYGEGRTVNFRSLFEETEKECRAKGVPKMIWSEFDN